ncbi:MAG TPA: DUF4340 domain-containing protein [Tepidisphaeraceae bacterium]|nr:DUF4340 domain-containing protein [Tepidisphaeraceae bacterium]
MNFRTTVILAAVLLAAGVFFFIATRSSDNTASDQATTSKSDAKGHALFDVKTDKLEKLAIRPDKGAPIEVARADGKWKILQPVDWPAESSKVESILSAVANLRSRGGVEMNSSNAASTGLDHPRFVIQAFGDGKRITLDVGNHSALGNDLYVKAGDAKQADLVAAGTLGQDLANGSDKLLDSLRSKQLVSVPEADVRQAQFVRRSGRLVLEKQGEDWQIEQPVKLPADASEASSLLDTVTGLQAAEFSDEAAAQQAGARFDHPRAVVWITSSAPTTAPATQAAAAPATAPADMAADAKTLSARGGATIVIGQAVDIQAEKVWVKIFDPSHPPVVAQAQFSKVSFDRLSQATPLELRDKRVMDIDPSKVASFTLAMDAPAPTTAPGVAPPAAAHMREFTIERRKGTPPVFGPALPRATNPITRPHSAATRPANTGGPTTRPAAPASAPAGSSSESASPTTAASAAPNVSGQTGDSGPRPQPLNSRSVPPSAATTQSSLAAASTNAPAATQPTGPEADQPAPLAWYFASGGEGKADDGQVTALLDSLHPLRVTKYDATSPTTQPVGVKYTLTIRTIPANAGESPLKYVIHITDPGPAATGPVLPIIGTYKDLIFEIDRSFIENLNGDFKTKKAAPNPPPSFGGGGLPPGVNFGQ